MLLLFFSVSYWVIDVNIDVDVDINISRTSDYVAESLFRYCVVQKYHRLWGLECLQNLCVPGSGHFPNGKATSLARALLFFRPETDTPGARGACLSAQLRRFAASGRRPHVVLTPCFAPYSHCILSLSQSLPVAARRLLGTPTQTLGMIETSVCQLLNALIH